MLLLIDCAHKHLNIAELHFNDAVTKKGYKALAYAIAVNTSLLSIIMIQDECYSGCCVPKGQWDYYDWDEHQGKDSSNGLFEKALRHNQSSQLQQLRLCYNAFGQKTISRLESLLA